MVEMVRYCPDCGADQLFGQHHPVTGECPDSPDGCCFEWFCAECGTALLIGFPVIGIDVAPARKPGRRVA
jgi:hypothetical protein